MCRYTLTLLRYIAVLTSKLNVDVLKTHLSVLKGGKYTDVMQYVEHEPTITTFLRYAILTSLFQLLSDHLYRKNPLVDQHCKEVCKIVAICLIVQDHGFVIGDSFRSNFKSQVFSSCTLQK